MPANGLAADDGRVKDLAAAMNDSLGRKADDAGVVKQLRAADGTPLEAVDGVVTLPAAQSGVTIAATDYAAQITN